MRSRLLCLRFGRGRAKRRKRSDYPSEQARLLGRGLEGSRLLLRQATWELLRLRGLLDLMLWWVVLLVLRSDLETRCLRLW